MKILVLLFAAVVTAQYEETYGTDHDDLDVVAVVSDKEQFNSFIDCFIDEGPCDEIAATFKSVIPEAVLEACAKCTPAQKHLVRVFNENLKKKMPEKYQKYKNKYDPEGKYFDNFEAAVASF
uniref:Chemosensory protein n=1 Tax=Heliothis virescens TaxID=7102 RepID=A0A2A4JQJ8_HELVI